MKKLLLILIAFSAAACSRGNVRVATERRAIEAISPVGLYDDALMERRVIEVIDAMERLDEAALNGLVNSALGVIFLYAPGVIYNIYKEDSVSFDKQTFGEGWAQWHFGDLEVSDKKIRYEALPEFDCNDEKWDKKPGIYCDTTVVSRQISELAVVRNRDFGDTWTEGEIAEFRNLEDNSWKFLALGERAHFIFYLRLYQGDYWLSVIEIFEPCSA